MVQKDANEYRGEIPPFNPELIVEQQYLALLAGAVRDELAKRADPAQDASTMHLSDLRHELWRTQFNVLNMGGSIRVAPENDHTNPRPTE